MTPETFQAVTSDFLLHAPAGDGRPPLLSNGHWLLRGDSVEAGTFEALARAFARACGQSASSWLPDFCAPWHVNFTTGPDGARGALSDAVLAGMQKMADMAAAPSWGPGAVFVVTGAEVALVSSWARGDLPTPLLVERVAGQYRGACLTRLVLSRRRTDGGEVRVGIAPAYYAAAQLRGWALESTADDAGAVDPIRLVAPGGRGVGLVMPVRLEVRR